MRSSLRRSALLMLILQFANSISGVIQLNRCYSCMSPLYEQLFKETVMSRYFFEPKNFTSQCDEPMQPKNIGLVPCRSICLTLSQDFVVMGRKTGKILTIRGCATSVNRYGFYNRTMTLFDRYDMCREVKASDLFRYETDPQPVRVCSCLGDRCNASMNRAKPSAVHTLLLVALLLPFYPLHDCL